MRDRGMNPSEQLISIVILCCNQAEITALCLQSLQRHTTWPHQIILVDNGSTDSTPQLLEQFARQGHPGLMSLSLIRNEENRGFAAGVNQALNLVQGEYIVLLNNDTVLTPHWLEGLLGVASNVPQAGLVGPVSNEVPEPQRVLPDYGINLSGLDTFAIERRNAFAGNILGVERISGFCLLIPREILWGVGTLDERFGLGFFEDDDLGIRVRQAGYKLLVALDTYIHHWGSQTVKSLGIDTQNWLLENHGKFKEKWGEEIAGRYRFVASEPISTENRAGEKAEVSLCMIVKNEEANLDACLSCVADLFEEMVIVDTGSTDQTKAIAERYGSKVVDFPWVDSFAAARNIAIENASKDYIFWLDADDRIDEANRDKLRQLFATLQRGKCLAYDMKCLCLPDPITKVTTVVDHIRLFPRHPEIRWKYRVHEQILPAIRQQGGSVRFEDIQIQHVGYQDPQLRKRKLERDIRLLQLENQEHPDDPFTLFNLGSVFLEMEKFTEAIPLLERSIARSHPADSIVRKLYALLLQAHKRLGSLLVALGVCDQGLKLYPQDAELLFQKAILLRELGHYPQAIEALHQLMRSQEEAHFASVDVGLKTFKALHNLAVIYRELGRTEEAREAWKKALVLAPDFIPARFGLAEQYLALNQEMDWQEQLRELQKYPELALDVELLQAKACMARKSFVEAKKLLADLRERYPDSVGVRIVLSHALLQEGIDWEGAEAALLEVLRLEPENREAQRNLQVLRKQGFSSEHSGNSC